MFFHFEHHIKVARRPAVGSGFAFPGDPHASAGIHAGRNAQLDGFLALDAPLAVAIRAALFHDLPFAPAGRARAGDAEETLLVGQLATATASLTGNDAGSPLCACAVTGFAVFLTGQLDLGGYARGSFLKGQRHVVTEIGTPLRTV